MRRDCSWNDYGVHKSAKVHQTNSERSAIQIEFQLSCKAIKETQCCVKFRHVCNWDPIHCSSSSHCIPLELSNSVIVVFCFDLISSLYQRSYNSAHSSPVVYVLTTARL